MSFYLPNPDVHPVGLEVAEFLDVVEPDLRPTRGDGVPPPSTPAPVAAPAPGHDHLDPEADAAPASHR